MSAFYLLLSVSVALILFYVSLYSYSLSIVYPSKSSVAHQCFCDSVTLYTEIQSASFPLSLWLASVPCL